MDAAAGSSGWTGYGGTGVSGAGGSDAGVEAGDATPDGYDDAAAILPVGAKIVAPGTAIDRQGNIVGWGAGWEPAYTPSTWTLLSPPPTGQFVDIAVNVSQACAIRTSGALTCWGDLLPWVGTPPKGQFSQISEASFHGCLLRLDGAVACWGAGTDPAGHFTCAAQGQYGSDPSCGQSAPPPGTFIQVTAGWLFSCGIRTDGTLACWGLGQPGDLCNGSQCPLMATPPGGTFTQISSYGSSSCGVRTDGTLACWPGAQPPVSGTFTQVSLSDYLSCAAQTDGSIVCWGWSTYLAKDHILPPPAGPFIEVAAGSTNTGVTACALRDDYTVVCWGDDTYGWVSQAPASL